MSTILLYTDSVRITEALGLHPEDLSETLFTQGDLERMLRADLYIWLPTHANYVVAVGSVASDEEVFRADCLSLFCTYFCASRILETGLGIMSKESDGQSEYTRISSLDLRAVSIDMEGRAAKYKQFLLGTIQLVEQAAPPVTIITPSYDPVTG
jgi:hypothetical protein